MPSVDSQHQHESHPGRQGIIDDQYAAQLQQLDRDGLLKEIENLRRLLTDLPPPTQ
jgi:hypothetical protein